MSNVVLVIDMVKGFMEPGHNLYCGDESREIIPRVHSLLAQERAAGSEILFISDHHDPDDLEFQVFQVHCVKGTEEPHVIPELSEFMTGDNVIPKNRYSGFFNTVLEARLAAGNAGQDHHLRRLHRHLRPAHRLRRPQPELSRRGALRLRGQLQSPGPHVGPFSSERHPGAHRCFRPERHPRRNGSLER